MAQRQPNAADRRERDRRGWQGAPYGTSGGEGAAARSKGISSAAFTRQLPEAPAARVAPAAPAVEEAAEPCTHTSSKGPRRDE